jgi:RNA polymerase sigma-70 factor (ECF subfamily)
MNENIRITLDVEKDFKQAFDTFYPRLLRFANGYVCNRFEAENIVQDVFLKLWEKRSLLQKDINLQAYLLTMVKNQCVDFLRHEQVVERNSVDWNSALQQEAAFSYYTICRFNPEQMDVESLERLVEKAINELPEQCRKAFELSRYEGLKYKDIADKMGISVKTVETHISHALKILRITLKDLFLVWLLSVSLNCC